MPKIFSGRPEHVPVTSYHLLRRLEAGAVDTATLFGTDDAYAIQFLTSRKLARLSGSLLTITRSGRAIGEVGEELSPIVLVDSLVAASLPTSARVGHIGAAGARRPLSETLLDAAENLNQLSQAHILILIRKAAKVLQIEEGEARELVDAANDDSHRPHVRH
jgi:hypothetical protein